MLEGVIRESIGKKSAKALRRDGYLIANIYGKGLENIHAAFKKGEFIRAVKSKENLAFPVKVGDKEINVVVQEYQKDPVTSDLLHVDLMVAQPGVVTYYMVPIKTVGTPKGLKNKGVLVISKRRIKVKGAIENVPNSITLDVTDLDVGDAILIRDIELPEGVQHMVADRVAVVGVIKAK
ncbi:50S ribosomal protein L25/general stress protein Ctc [Nitrosophilus alvini]|uniref:50S ribosomal protein L25/general stress protein Ctc n=1 Tax=Nitrosophilus alvini TaxID=2714855 RepID=UPI00190E3E76|nr:50S ribosomal protein L25/general stress protein Ctc [Nitrosophilus alvini]